MKKKNNLLCVFLSFLLCMVMLPASAVSAATVLTENKTGTEDGYNYELWKDTGTTSMTLTGGGTFNCEWSNINNALFRKGIKFDCTKTYQEIGNISIDFAADYKPNGNSYLCVYGWTRSPLVEYYIVEAWGSWRPPGATSKGTVTIDGGVYDIYETTRENQPSIDGNTTFQQYWSVRQDKRTSGTINVGAHFAAWESMGMPMGKLYEAALNVEGYQSSGSAVISKNTISVGGEIPNPENTDEPVEPDKDGYYFHSTYESSTDSWTTRGDASVKAVNTEAYAGNQSLSVENRTDSWNGTSRSLSTSTFVPGKSYSFSTMAMQNSTSSEDFKLTLQYDLDGEANYATIAEATGSKSEWVQLANTNYVIPSGASNLLLYVETSDSTTNYYIDEAIGASSGTVINTEQKYSVGDVNLDGKIDENDILALKSFILCKTSDINFETADMNDDGILNSFDLVLLKKAVINKSDTPSDTNATEYMANVRANMTANVPSTATSSASGTDYGTLKPITYYSTNAAKNKKANVLLPAGYSENEKYPVLYVNHGIFGDENSMLDESMKIKTMAGNLAKSGDAEKMIIVFTSMYTSKTSDTCQGINLEETKAYDNFLYDLTEDLMPYIEKNFSVKTGRENTAISGFSMGGRETLYIGIMRPDVFGYIGAACPAPGVTPGTDTYMVHPGCMQESEFKIKNTSYNPYVLMITGGTNDTVVGTFPQSYHNILTANGQDHIWQEIQGGGHDASCVVPLMYNFIKGIFKNGETLKDDEPEKGGVDISWIDPSKPMVAISFDDGAVGTDSNSTSMRILNSLSGSGFHATFFYVGNWTNSSNQGEIKTAYDMGMEIANHTNSHPYLTNLSASEIRSEYDTCAQKLKAIIGTDPSPLLRLPYLASNSTVQSALYDVSLITCAIDTQDWNSASSDQIISKIKTSMSDGTLDNSIVLCHETYESTATAMEYLCPYLKSQGWQIVTISEMFAVNGKALNGGQIYSKCN